MTLPSETFAERVARRLREKQESTQGHICGNCRTPTGRSALPCKNDPNRRTT